MSLSTLSTTSTRLGLSLTDLSTDQKNLIARLSEDNVLAIAPMGFGKAVCAQTAIQNRLDSGLNTRVLVLAPKAVALHVWANEWAHWDHLEPVGVAVGTAKHRENVIKESKYRIVVLNIEALPWFFANYTRGRPHNFDGLVIDEISKFKTAGGRRTRGLRGRLGLFPWRVGLSATPVAESGVDIYSQLLLVDGGKALGRSKQLFLNEFFTAADYHRRNWQFRPGGIEALGDAVKPSVYYCTSDANAPDLPPLIEKYIPVWLPDEAQRMSIEIARDYTTSTEGKVKKELNANNAAVVIGKLQQLARGAIIDHLDQPHWVHTEKFDALELYIENHPNASILVAYHYIFEKEELQRRFPDMRMLSDPGAVEAWNNKQCKLLAIHPAAAGHGLNLQAGGNTIVLLGPIWSADQWRQLLGRLRRRGQQHPVTRVVFVAEGRDDYPCVEREILNRLAGKEDTELAFMQHLWEVTRG